MSLAPTLRALRLAFPIAAALALTPAAQAGVIVEYKATVAAGWAVQGQNLTPAPGIAWDIALDHCQPGFWRVRVVDPTTESLGLVSFTNSTAAITLIIGGVQDNATNPAAQFQAAGCQDWTNGLDPGTAIVTLQARVGRDIGPMASIRAQSIVRIDAGGAIHQSAIHHQSATDTLAAITAVGDIDDNLDDPNSAAIIRSEGGRISLVQAGGTIASPISVQPLATSGAAPLAGTLGTVRSTGADIGGARPSTALADNYHATVISARTIDAVIGRNVRNDITATQGVAHVEATFAGLRGSITAPTVMPIDSTHGGLISAAGVNAMKITLSSGLPKEARIVSGLYYGYTNIADASQPRITLGGTDKLAGQIIVNASNAPRPIVSAGATVPRTLMGPVVITGGTTTTITQDNYLPISTTIGGGAIGVGSYQLYEADCTPPNNQLDRQQGVVETAFNDPTAVPVVVRSYGPVILPSGVSDPNTAFTIEKQDGSNACLWTNVNPMFNVVLHPLTPGTNEQRAIGLSRGTQAPVPGIYRVVPGSLLCDGVASVPSVVWFDSCTGQSSHARAYLFRIAPDCDDDGINDYVEIDALGGSPIQTGSNNSPKGGTGTPISSGNGSSPGVIAPGPIGSPPNPDPDPGSGDPGTGDPNPSDNPGDPGGGGGSGGNDPPPPPPALTCITVCLLDVNHDHAINVQDIFDFLALWFAGDIRADWNRSGVLEVQDIFAFLNDWFNASRTDC